MNNGIGTIIYPVKDIAKAKALFVALLGVEPYMDEAYYVGFKVGNQDIGLDPHGFNKGFNMPLGYYHVSDIRQSVQTLVDVGAEVLQDVKDIGGGKQIAVLKDADGNIFGVLQMPDAS